ncbi:hypothetical protein AA313_de0209173 [Arthrobotrys entomopaga]|nr:hypothetical protein AA313_de0209173 [Arthrobotrys entomopaga]
MLAWVGRRLAGFCFSFSNMWNVNAPCVVFVSGWISNVSSRADSLKSQAVRMVHPVGFANQVALTIAFLCSARPPIVCSISAILSSRSISHCKILSSNPPSAVR